MIKDIEFPEIEEVSMAVVKEFTDAGDEEWFVYLLNESKRGLHGVLIASKGYGKIENRRVKTSTMRHFFENLQPKSFVKVELIKEEVLKLTNEYWLSFYQGEKMYDKKYIFVPESITDRNLSKVPLMNRKGILHP